MIVTGSGPAGLSAALTLSYFKLRFLVLEAGARVTLIHRKGELRACEEFRDRILNSPVQILWTTELKSVSGNPEVERAALLNNRTGEEKILPFDNIFIFIGYVLDTSWLKKMGLKMRGNCLKVNKSLMTSIKGVFSAGDISSNIKRIPQALAQGERAAYSTYKYLRHPYWEKNGNEKHRIGLPWANRYFKKKKKI